MPELQWVERRVKRPGKPAEIIREQVVTGTWEEARVRRTSILESRERLQAARAAAILRLPKIAAGHPDPDVRLIAELLFAQMHNADLES